MQAREGRVYFPNNIGGFDLYQIVARRVRPSEAIDKVVLMDRAQEAAEFFATACNEHAELTAQNQLLREKLGDVEALLEVANDNIEAEAKVQTQLVAALQAARVYVMEAPTHYKAHINGGLLTTAANGALQMVDAALTAAGVRP